MCHSDILNKEKKRERREKEKGGGKGKGVGKGNKAYGISFPTMREFSSTANEEKKESKSCCIIWNLLLFRYRLKIHLFHILEALAISSYCLHFHRSVDIIQ